MDLKNKQLELQKDSFKEIVIENKQSIENQKVRVFLDELANKILIDKKKGLQEVVKKIIKETEQKFKEILNVELKNIQNYISEILSLEIIEKYERKDTQNHFEEFKKINQNFISLSEESYIKSIEFLDDLLKDNYENLTISLSDKNQMLGFYLFPLSTNQIAYVLLIQTLQISSKENDDEENTATSRQNIGNDIGDYLWDLVKYKYLMKNFPHYEEKDIDELEWDIKEKESLSQLLIDILIETEYLQEYQDKTKDKKFNYLTITENFQEEIQKLDKKLLNKINVTFKPMIVEPLDWNDIDDGGFLRNEDTSPEFKLLLIKSNDKKEKRKVYEKKGKLPNELLNAINNLQKTAFKINGKMLDVLKNYKLERKKGKINSNYYKMIIDALQRYKKGLVISDKKIRNKVEKLIKKNPDILTEFKLLYKMAKFRNSFDNMLAIADEFKEFEKIYFVYQIDFRGRVYPKQTLLNPQGGDIAKSLLLFSEEKKLNEKGIEWFKIHGANLYGEVDKRPFDERIKWIEENEENILKCAKNYTKEEFWKKADEPFEFLAFCFEYERFTKDRNNFYTSIPVAIDGSNNGLQHISTLLRDIQAAKNVNVLPNEKNEVADVYNLIADGLKEKLRKEKIKFEKNRDKFFEKDGLLYKKEIKKEIDERENAQKLLKILKNIDIKELRNMNVTTYLSAQLNPNEEKYLEKMETLTKKYLKSKEGKKVENYKILKRLIRDIEEDIEEFEEDIKNGISKKEKNHYKKEVEKNIFVSESLIDKIEKKIDRSFVKNAVMTDSYGASTSSKAIALKDKIEKLQIINIEDFEKRNKIITSFANYLAKLIDKIIDEKIESSEKYKKWIKIVAKEILSTNKNIEFKTPIGFVVSQSEYMTKSEFVSCGYGKKLKINSYTDEINKKDNRKGFAPNYIHSLDATHLYLTINSLSKEGIKDFLTVHDSFATHANDVTLLSETLKKEFIKLYENPVLEEFIKDINERFNLNIDIENDNYKIPYINKKEFNLEEIMKSPYFFA